MTSSENTVRIGRVKPNAVTVDTVVQRGLSIQRAQEMADRFDPAAVGVITVSDRDGNRYVVDGQHRVEAAKLAGLGDVALDAKIYTGLTRVDEAKLFIALNSARIPGAVDRFKVRLQAEDPVPVAIVAVIREFGWEIGGPGADGKINSVSALEEIWALDPDGSRGVLNDTLRVITGAWGYAATGTSAPVLRGVAALIDRYGRKLDLPALSKKMTGAWASPVVLVGMGKSLKATRGGRLPLCVAEVLHSTYNSKRRSGVLEPW